MQMGGPIPNIFSRGSAQAHMTWLEKVFAAKGEILRSNSFTSSNKKVQTCLTMKDDPSKVLHGAISIQGGRCFLSDRTVRPFFVYFFFSKANTKEMMAGVTPMDLSESVQLYLGFPTVEEAQKAWDIAIENGATVRMAFKPQEWGRQYGILTDPFGVTW